MNDLNIYLLSSLCITFLWLILRKRSFSSISLCFYHILLGGIYLSYTINNSSDAQEYFHLGNLSSCSFTDSLNRFDITNLYFIFCFSGLLKKIFNNYGFVSSLFSFLGFLGLNYFYTSTKILIENKNFERYLVNIVFFLPSISFWTSGISKDTLIIFAYSLIFKFATAEHLKINKSFLGFISGSLLIFFTRPYSFIFLLISAFISRFKLILKIFKSKKSFSKKLIFFIIGSLIFIKLSIFILGSILQIGGGFSFNLSKLNIGLLSERINYNYNQALNSGGSYISAIGINKLSLILFGPFSSKSINYLFESISGIVFGIVFCSLISKLIFSKIEFFNTYLLFIFSICFFELLKFQYAVFNLGIIARQRTHIFILITILFSYIVNMNKRKSEAISE